ncbi:lipid-transfer protein [Pseudonocardia ailaonensis]|uniref:Lipid-transfer protein n=1 Tax=Pseudonocardia ailaonensis TaxID=367279 RepID=A0ABN2MZA9_9PSEU
MSSSRPSFAGNTAIAGVGYTELTRNSGRSVLAQAVEACRAAIDHAGLEPDQVDGIVSYSVLNDSVLGQAVAAGLGGVELSYAVDLNLGGQAPCHAVALAAMAVDAGLAENVLVYRALNGRSALRIGSTSYASPTSEFRYPIGFGAYPQYIAMWARRYLVETGGTAEDLGAIVLAQRAYAERNPRAIVRNPITMDEYLAMPYVVDPFRRADCTSEVDGACAVLVTSRDRARDLRQRPAVIDSAAWVTPRCSGLDMADLFMWPDWSRNCHSYLADQLWERASVSRAEVDFAEIYDCFSAVVPMALEGLGMCERGAAPGFVADGRTGPDGPLPVNTHGGLLSEGYLHGMNTLAEAVLQIQGNEGERQLQRNDVALVTSGALMDGSALVLVGE